MKARRYFLNRYLRTSAKGGYDSACPQAEYSSSLYSGRRYGADTARVLSSRRSPRISRRHMDLQPQSPERNGFARRQAKPLQAGNKNEQL